MSVVSDALHIFLNCLGAGQVLDVLHSALVHERLMFDFGFPCVRVSSQAPPMSRLSDALRVFFGYPGAGNLVQCRLRLSVEVGSN